jgi:hypothetical protein
MENFIGQDRPNVHPMAVCSSLAANIKQNITEASASPQRTKNKLKRQRNSPRTEMSTTNVFSKFKIFKFEIAVLFLLLKL